MNVLIFPGVHPHGSFTDEYPPCTFLAVLRALAPSRDAKSPFALSRK
jgi:hypothetical protein